MIGYIRSSIVLLLMLTLLLGGLYPLTVTAIAQFAFSDKSAGSLVERDGKIIGSKLLGQQFTDAKYFWGRLSATTPPYNAAASSGSNLSVANPKLLESANARMEMLQKFDPKNKTLIPADLLTASASGLDPHISIASAEYQLLRVAKARRLSEAEVAALLARFKHTPHFGFFGEFRVNVLELNLALDELSMVNAKEKR